MTDSNHASNNSSKKDSPRTFRSTSTDEDDCEVFDEGHIHKRNFRTKSLKEKSSKLFASPAKEKKE
jgi:hypothetical protein